PKGTEKPSHAVGPPAGAGSSRQSLSLLDSAGVALPGGEIRGITQSDARRQIVFWLKQLKGKDRKARWAFSTACVVPTCCGQSATEQELEFSAAHFLSLHSAGQALVETALRSEEHT